jgi:hypothetical protein
MRTIKAPTKPVPPGRTALPARSIKPPSPAVRLLLRACTLLLIVTGTPARLAAQVVPPGADTLAAVDHAAPLVYVDCRRCDHNYIRQEIPFVNHVRDPLVAQVYVLVSDQQTGGGRMFTLEFEGRGPFGDLHNTLQYAAPGTQTSAEERAGLTDMLKLGLVQYAARTTLASRLRLQFEGETETAALPLHDPWRNWTFEVYAGGNFNRETRQSAWNSRYGVRSDRVTDEWKLRVRAFFNHNSRVILRENNPDIRTEQIRHGLTSYVIRSLGPHFGAGLFGEYNTSTIDNLAHGATLNPAIEYSIFPYAEATRRQITLTYRLGLEFADYLEETIFEQTAETLAMHALDAALRYQQRWGSISSSITASSYLHDIQYHRLRFDGSVALRIAGGLSMTAGASYQRINDQLALPRGDASLEDILLDRRRLATSFRATGNMGLSYTFGSIFSNVVNPRF